MTMEGKKPYFTPRELRDDEIPGIVTGFKKAAENALAAGFDGVEDEQVARFDDELRFDPFWALGEHDYTGQIQEPIMGGGGYDSRGMASSSP
jgi:hypothetical protein